MESTDALISPCRCSGSLKYIHESCLKTWLASKLTDIENANCEICKTEFLMDFVVTSKCSPAEAFGDGLSHCLFVPLLLVVLGLLFVIIFVIGKNLMEGKDSDMGYAITLMATCCLSSIVLTLLVINALKEACVRRNLREWRIFSQEFEDYIDTEQAEFKTEMNLDLSQFPKVVRFNGKMVRTVPNTENQVAPDQGIEENGPSDNAFISI